MIHHSPAIAAALQTLVLAIASEVSSDPDALIPVLHAELEPFVRTLCNDVVTLDGEQGDDTNAHGFYGTHTTDAAW